MKNCSLLFQRLPLHACKSFLVLFLRPRAPPPQEGVNERGGGGTKISRRRLKARALNPART